MAAGRSGSAAKTRRPPDRKGGGTLAGKSGPPARMRPVLDLHRAIGNRGVARLLEAGRLRVSRQGEREEREAESEARRMLAAPGAVADRAPAVGQPPAATAADWDIARTRPPAGAGGTSPPPAVHAELEGRLGRDLGEVRLHRDARAAAAARAVDAKAYTVGREVVFGAGQYAPESAEGRRLLAHELAHVAQQARRPHAPPVLQRQVRTPPVRTFDQLWADFLRDRQQPQQALRVVPDLLAIMNVDQARAHALTLALWLMDQGRWDLAQTALDQLETSIELDWVTNQLIPVSRATLGYSLDQRLRDLVDRAKVEARADRHQQAFRLFELSFFFAQRLLQTLSERRREELERIEEQIGAVDARAVAIAEARTFGLAALTSSSFQSVYDVLREILGFYSQEERAALLAGDADRARRLSGLGLMLRVELQEQALSGQRAVTLQTVAAYNARGQRGFRMSSFAGGVEEIVTPLPGTRTPEELGLFPAYSSPFATERPGPTVEDIISGRLEQMERMPPEIGLVESIAGQEVFVTELYHHPEIRRAFGRGGIDMNNVEHRHRVWRIMYGVYERTNVAGTGGLHSLMSLMGRYLRVFTRHTEYNIRDFGVSYLSSEFPVDFAGQAARDCGVYALKVAYEVYRASRAALPGQDLRFRLYSMPEHVTLVIFDVGRNQHYIVNNNEISPPREGGPAGQEVLANVAQTYGATFGRAFHLTPAQPIELGTTRLGDAAFRRLAWERYLLSTLWGLRPLQRSPGDTRTDAELAQAAYRRYYDDLVFFDRHAGRLQNALDALTREVQAGSATDFAARLSTMFDVGLRLGVIFERYGPYTPGDRAATVAQGDPAVVRGVLGAGWTPQRVARELGGRSYLFAHQPRGRPHPLTRLARALVQLRTPPSANETAYVNWIRSHPDLGPDLVVWERAGGGAAF